MKDNYIAIIISKWHLYGLETLILKNDPKSYNSITIYVEYHEVSKRFRLSDSDFSILEKYPVKVKYITDYKDVISDINKLSKNRGRYTIINPLNLSFNLYLKFKLSNIYNKISYIILDEGAGHYFSKELFEVMAGKKEREKKTYIKHIKYILRNLFIKLFIDIEYRTLFDLNKIELSLNDEVAFDLKRYFDTISRKEYEIKDIDNKSILLVSDNLSNICLNDKYEIKQYKLLIDTIKKKFGDYTIYLKPHPNELNNLQKFSELKEIKILKENISFENLINNNNFEYICGFSSTSLITCRNVFEKKCYTLNALLNKKLLSQFGIDYIENFLNLCNKFNIEILK